MVQQLNTACLIIDITFEVVGTIFCLGRLWSRLVSPKGTWRGLMMWSDICMFIAWIFTVGETISIIFVTILAHYGYHLRDQMRLPPHPLELAKWDLVSGLCYNPILGFIKASMILLYLRLGGTKKGVRMACYGLLSLTLSLTLALDLADAFECSPVSYVWNSRAMDLAAQQAQNATEVIFFPGYGPVSGFKNGVYITGGKCFNRAMFIMVAAGLAILTDLMILCIPVYMVYDLKMKPRKKLVVLLILCMGICITAVSITRLVFSYQLVYPPKGTDNNFNVHSTISQIEGGLALVTGNIPDLFPVIRRWYPNFLRSDSPDILAPNPYPYHKSNSGSANSAYSTRVQKSVVVPPMGSTRVLSKEEGEETFGMETYGWRGDMVTTGEVQVKGGAARSLTESEEAIIDEELGKAGGIVKTTHFVVQEDTGPRPSREDNRWSNV